MLDIKLIRDDPELVRERLASRGRGDDSPLTEIAALYQQLRKLSTESDALKAAQNKVNKEIGVLKAEVAKKQPQPPGPQHLDLEKLSLSLKPLELKKLAEQIASKDSTIAELE